MIETSVRHAQLPALRFLGRGLTRDSVVSVMYPTGLNSTKSSVTLQRTDQHGIVGQKPAHFPVSLCERPTKRSPTGPADWAAKSRMPRLQRAMGRRNGYPESWFWATEEGRRW
jgi:hypothetical protein